MESRCSRKGESHRFKTATLSWVYTTPFDVGLVHQLDDSVFTRLFCYFSTRILVVLYPSFKELITRVALGFVKSSISYTVYT